MDIALSGKSKHMNLVGALEIKRSRASEENLLPFSVLSILQDLGNKLFPHASEPFKDVLLVSIQHIMGTTVDLFRAMQELGLKEAIIGGKTYSTHQESAVKIKNLGFTYIHDKTQLGYGHFDDCMREVVHAIWAQALLKLKQKKYKLVLVLDDGSDLLRATPGILFDNTLSDTSFFKPDLVIGIEQTRGGINHPLFGGLPFPIINVASSYVKAKIEYIRVAEVIVNKLEKIITEEIFEKLQRNPVIGIMGYGTMGRAIAKKFLEKNFEVIVYDKHKKNYLDDFIYYDHSPVMISNADIIIGCTGEDITLDPANLSAITYSRQTKWLVSASSKDHEFNALLRKIQYEKKFLGSIPDALKTITYLNINQKEINIIKGGFPINFDNSEHSVPPQYIWPTRASLFLAALSAVNLTNKERLFQHNINLYMLTPSAQLLILRKYIQLNPKDECIRDIKELNDDVIIDKFIKNSDSIFIP